MFKVFQGRKFRGGMFAVLATFIALVPLSFAFAESSSPVERLPERKSKKLLRNKSLDAISVFRPDFVKRTFFEELEVHDVSKDQAQAAAEAKPTTAADQPATSQDPNYRGPLFVDKFKPGDLLPPEANPRIRVNEDAPAPFIGMVTAHQNGDNELAAKYADQWVRYQQNFVFELRELVDIIGASLIRQKVIQDDDWDGVSQVIDYEFAKTRKETGDLLKPTHDKAMARIKADPKGEAEIYYLFSMNCRYCRFMAADVERLWRVMKNDPKAKMVALTLGPTRNDWVDEYRKYTGLSLPIFDGEKVAKALRIKFAPVLVVVSPNGNQAYIKSGQQSFEHMYDFVRHVQGLPANLTPEVQQVLNTPIGEIELQKLAKRGNSASTPAGATAGGYPVRNGAAAVVNYQQKVEMDRF